MEESKKYNPSSNWKLFWHDRSFIHATIVTTSLPTLNLLKTQNLESVFPSCCAVCLVLLASCWALFNFYDSSHSWKQRKIDIQGDYGNVFLTQKMTQFLWLKLSIHYSGSPHDNFFQTLTRILKDMKGMNELDSIIY